MLSSIGRKLPILVATAIATGFVGVVGFFAREHEKNILLQNERTVRQVTESVVQGVQTVMLAGYADVAEHYVDRLKKIDGVIEFRILRTNGLEAFQDNSTIAQVNAVRGEELFEPRISERRIQALPADDHHLRDVVENKRLAYYYGQGESGRTLTYLWPILKESACRRCHGGNDELRGVLQLTSSMAAVEAEVREARTQAAVVAALVLVAIVVIISLFLRRSVIAPIEELSRAMQRVSGGELGAGVPICGAEELERTARGFNAMLADLRATWSGFRVEHDKLETLIRGASEGIVVTNADGAIVLVNAAAGVLLGRSAARITEGGFDALFDDPARMATLLRAERGADDTVCCNDRILAVSAAVISTDDGRQVGKAALLRDMTEEKRLEQALRKLSDTDGLTGLANRRLLDEALQREVTRSLAHGRKLSILMFDVDHFKRFNDTHGHDQGDRVLKAVAAVAQSCVRTVDLACRYGGEEFLIILTETDQAGAAVVAERMRVAVEETRVDGLQVTISIGVAGLLESGASTSAAFVDRADAALYVAKRSGRNLVVEAV